MTYTIQNQSYGNSVVDIYMPYWSKKPWPCIFSIHGGGWAIGNEDEGPTIEHAKKLVSHDFMIVSVRYSLAPDNKWPTQLIDTFEAINFIRTGQYSKYIGKCGLIGASAGAHIAAMAMNVRTFMPSVLLYGPYDLAKFKIESRWVYDLYVPQCFGTLQDSKSPFNRVPPANLLKPTLLIHGKKDLAVDYNQSVRYHQKLKAVNDKSELILIDNADHCLTHASQSDLDMVDAKILDFFSQNLK